MELSLARPRRHALAMRAKRRKYLCTLDKIIRSFSPERRHLFFFFHHRHGILRRPYNHLLNLVVPFSQNQHHRLVSFMLSHSHTHTISTTKGRQREIYIYFWMRTEHFQLRKWVCKRNLAEHCERQHDDEKTKQFLLWAVWDCLLIPPAIIAAPSYHVLTGMTGSTGWLWTGRPAFSIRLSPQSPLLLP